MYFNLFDGGDVLAARPTPLVEVRPQPGVLRHTAAHFEDIVTSCRSLMCLCRSWRTLLRKIDAPALVEQVIAVPKISVDRVPQRSACRRSRRAEQLVEVPTIVSYCSLHGNVEQNVDIPVPHRRGGRGGLQDLRPGQDSTAFCGADHVDNPVPRVGGLQGFLPRHASIASSSHSPGAADEAFTREFSRFSPNFNKVRGWVRTRGRN